MEVTRSTGGSKVDCAYWMIRRNMSVEGIMQTSLFRMIGYIEIVIANRNDGLIPDG